MRDALLNFPFVAPAVKRVGTYQNPEIWVVHVYRDSDGWYRVRSVEQKTGYVIERQRIRYYEKLFPYRWKRIYDAIKSAQETADVLDHGGAESRYETVSRSILLIPRDLLDSANILPGHSRYLNG